MMEADLFMDYTHTQAYLVDIESFANRNSNSKAIYLQNVFIRRSTQTAKSNKQTACRQNGIIGIVEFVNQRVKIWLIDTDLLQMGGASDIYQFSI